MRAPLLALLGLLVAVTPAFAARSPDRGQTTPRAKVAAPASPAAGKPARATPRPAAAAPRPTAGRSAATAPRGGRSAVSPVRSARAAAAPARGQATNSRDRRKAVAVAAAPASTACRGKVRNCRLYRVSAPQPMRWSQGLSPALNVQTSNCPAGTMATLATGHSDVVRCMPI
jgi:hypothetical protein